MRNAAYGRHSVNLHYTAADRVEIEIAENFIDMYKMLLENALLVAQIIRRSYNNPFAVQAPSRSVSVLYMRIVTLNPLCKRYHQSILLHQSLHVTRV